MDASSIVAPLLVVAGLVTFLLRPGGVGRLAFGRWVSRSWPWAKTTIGYGCVDVVSQGRGGPVYELTVSYSYSVDGQEYGGDYTERFQIEHEAQDLLKSLQDLPPPARYKPADPSVSVMDPYRDAALGVTLPR